MKDKIREFKERICTCDINGAESDIGHFPICPVLELEEIISFTISKSFEEERQFILNVLDGIDIADEKMGNNGGGTKAIRFALQSRVNPYQPK